MKSLMVAVLLFFSLQVAAKEVSVGDSGITFDAPDDFAPLSQTLIDTKWPSKRAPRWAVGNTAATTTIAFDIKKSKASQRSLGEMMKTFKTVFDRVIPGIVWKERKLVTLSGQQWLYMEMTSSAADTDIHNIMLITDFKGEMLTFNFNATKTDFKRYEAVLRKSIESIRLP